MNIKGGHFWSDNMRNGCVWADDPVEFAEHVAMKTKQKLHVNELLTVGQIAALADHAICTISKQADTQKRIGYTTLWKIREKIQLSNDLKPDPILVNHMKAAYPYLSKFGGSE
jgi:hypothetical protein